jgi:hypothetical protein
VETPVPLSATHAGLVALKAMPHAFTRFGSTVAAHPGTSETRFVCEYVCALATVGNPAAIRVTATAKNAARALLGIHQVIAILLEVYVAIDLALSVPMDSVIRLKGPGTFATRKEPKQDPFTMSTA